MTPTNAITSAIHCPCRLCVLRQSLAIRPEPDKRISGRPGGAGPGSADATAGEDGRHGMRIAIAGAGIGGLAAAALLRADGHQVAVFDQFERPAPVGSGLVIQPVGQAVLKAVGVGPAVLAQGQRIVRMRGHDAGSGGSFWMCAMIAATAAGLGWRCIVRRCSTPCSRRQRRQVRKSVRDAGGSD